MESRIVLCSCSMLLASCWTLRIEERIKAAIDCLITSLLA